MSKKHIETTMRVIHLIEIESTAMKLAVKKEVVMLICRDKYNIQKSRIPNIWTFPIR